MHTARHNAGTYRAALAIAMMAGWLGTSAGAAERMPTAQQNALVGKYCAVCHTDAVKNGGLSLEHFDAAKASPSLMAMLLSKLSGGVSLEMVKKADTDAGAAALVNRKMRSGAMGAAGIPIPDKATIDALIHAFAVESKGATEWTVERTTASILREMPSATNAGEARVYRLAVSCNREAREGLVQLAWSPLPHAGTLAVSADGKAAVRYPVAGSEKMGNGSGAVTSGLAALALAETRSLPADSLAVGELFEGETVVFSFADLPRQARQELEACFPNANSPDGLTAGR